MIAFNFLEPLLHVVPSPDIITDQIGPVIMVLIRTNDPTTKVDGGTTTETPAARIIYLLTLQLRLWGCLVAPIHLGSGEG